VGGIGGTGSRVAHTGGQISSKGNTSLCRRFAICDEAQYVLTSGSNSAAEDTYRPLCYAGVDRDER
jgi:hypothetical protein